MIDKEEMLEFISLSEVDFLDDNFSLSTFIDQVESCPTEVLLNLLKDGAEDSKTAYQSFTIAEDREMALQSFHAIGKCFAPVAFVVYERLCSKNEEPRIPTYLAINRYRSTDSAPDTIAFWADPDAIRGLYESLEKDGYYAGA